MSLRLRQREMRAVLAAWHDAAAASALEQAARVDVATELLLRRRPGRLLAAWSEVCANAAAAGAATEKLRGRAAARHLAAVFQAWRLESVGAAGQRLATLATAAEHLIVFRYAAVFAAWRQAVIESSAIEAAADDLNRRLQACRLRSALTAWQAAGAASRETLIVADARWTACQSRTVHAALTAWQLLAADRARCRAGLLGAFLRKAAAMQLRAAFGSWRQVVQRLNQAQTAAWAADMAREGRCLAGAFQGWQRRAQGVRRRRLHRAQAGR